MPLTNDVIIKLNEISILIEDKSNLKESEIEGIKGIFKNMLKNGQDYNVEEIESWLKNEGSWKNKDVRVRITNLSHFIQSKHQQTTGLRVISDNEESCNCGS